MDPEESAAPMLNQGEEAAEAAESAPAEEERPPPVQEVPAGDGSPASGAGEVAPRAHPEEEELARQVMEVDLQNEYLRSQIAGAQPAGGADEGSELVRGLKEQVEKLTSDQGGAGAAADAGGHGEGPGARQRGLRRGRRQGPGAHRQAFPRLAATALEPSLMKCSRPPNTGELVTTLTFDKLMS